MVKARPLVDGSPAGEWLEFSSTEEAAEAFEFLKLLAINDGISTEGLTLQVEDAASYFPPGQYL